MKNSKTVSLLTLAMLMLHAGPPAASKPENKDNTENRKTSPSKVRQGTVPEKAPQMTNLPQPWQTLKTAKQLSSADVGEAATPLREYQAFLAVAPIAGSQRSEIDKLLIEGSPAGKLYGASLLYAIDHKAGLTALQQLADSKEKVTYRSGCEVMNETVGNIAQNLLKTGRFMDWTLGAK